MFNRIIELDSIIARKSVFLFGPRQTGKSTWLKNRYPMALYINLLRKRTFDFFSNTADALESEINLFKKESNQKKQAESDLDNVMIVIIDEIQLLPNLLNDVQNMIETDKKLRFILTGSSARKLKRSGANLLGGRASWRSMFPLLYPEIRSEIKTSKDLTNRLLRGGLPSIFTSKTPFDDFDDYIQLYLNEEIKSEGQVRKYDSFHRFLSVAARTNAQQVNFTQVGSDAQVPPRTIHDYYQILEDTLIGFMLTPFLETKTRKAMSSSKFYLFDTGLTNAIINRTSLSLESPEAGGLFEQFIIIEIKAFCSYHYPRSELFYWRSQTKQEIDLIIRNSDQIWAIEIKCKNHINNKDLSGLLAFAEDMPNAKKYIIGLDVHHQITKDVNRHAI